VSKEKKSSKENEFIITDDMGNTIYEPLTVEILINELKKWPKDWNVVVPSGDYNKFHEKPTAIFQLCSDAKIVSIWQRGIDNDDDLIYMWDKKEGGLIPRYMVHALKFLQSEIKRMPGKFDDIRPYCRLLDLLWEQIAEYYFRIDHDLPIKKPLTKGLLWHEWSRDKEKFLKDLPFLRERMKDE